MPWMDLKGAVIMMIVAFIALKVAGGPIAHAMEAVTDNFDLGWGKPKIGSFSAVPAEDGNLAFAATLGGNKDNAVLEIHSSYTEKAEGSGNFRAPDPPNTEQKQNLVYTSEGKNGGKLEKKFNVKCPADEADCGGTVSQAMGGVSTLSGKFKPGWYTFVAVLKKDGSTKDVKRFELGFYDESYLELFDNPVSGCSDCDVIECKRAKLIAKLGSNIPEKCREGVMIIYNELVNKNGGKVGRTCDGGQCCDYPAPSQMQAYGSIGPITFNGCTAAQINDVYQKAAAFDFYRRVCEEAKVDALTEFMNAAEKLWDNKKWTVDSVKADVKNDFAQCSNSLEKHLRDKLGWKQMAISGSAGDRNEKYGRVIASYLDNREPNLDSAAVKSDENGVMAVSWSVPVGKNNVKGFEINHVVTRLIYKEGNEIKSVTSSPERLEKGPATRSFSHAVPRENQLGWHEFTISATSNADSNFKSNEVKAGVGLYNQRFIEYYQQPPKTQYTESYWCIANCDVIGNKKALIKKVSPSAEEIYGGIKAKFDELGCVYEKGSGMDNCKVPEAVNLMYEKLMGKFFSASYDKVTGSNCDLDSALKLGKAGFEGDVRKVCSARRVLTEELNKKGWQEASANTPIILAPSEVRVQDFRLVPNPDGTISASWVLSGPVESIKSFEIKHEHRRYAQDREDQFVNVLPVSVAPTGGNVYEKIRIGPFDSTYDGSHRFTLKALDSIKYELASGPSPATVNLYDDRYIELYDSDATSCGKNSLFKMQDGCNVVGKKRQFIRKNDVAKGIYNSNPEIKALFDCDFDRLYKDGKGCRPEAVHALYEAAIKKQYPGEEQQKGFLSIESCKPDTGDTCKARKNLANNLKNRGWVKITGRAANIQPIMPETHYTGDEPKTIPEKPLPGELFKLVIDITSTQPLRWLRMQQADSTEWSILPCDWLGNTCRREWNNLFFEPSPKPIKISAVDVTGRPLDLPSFTPAASSDCRERMQVGAQWVGCLGKASEEVVFECNSDGTTTAIVAEKEEARKLSSFLCGGIVDYGKPEFTKSPCIYSCEYDVECRAAGGSVAPYACPAEKAGYGVTMPVGKVCCEPHSVQEVNQKAIAVLSVITGVMNQNIEANTMGGFFFVFDLINPVKMFIEGSKLQTRESKLNLIEKLMADAEQGTPLVSVVGTMNELRLSKAKDYYLNEKYDSIGKQFMAYRAKLEVAMSSKDKAVRDQAVKDFDAVGGYSASMGLFVSEQKWADENAIAQSNTPLVLAIAKYDDFSGKDDDRQYDVLDDIYYEVAGFFKGLGDDGMAIEMYNVVVDYFPESDYAVDARSKVANLKSFGHRALVLSKGMAIDIFGDPTFYMFGGPKALMSVGKASAAGFVAKSRQMVKLAGKTGSLSQELVVKAASQSRAVITRENAAILAREFGKSATGLTKEAVNVLREIAAQPIRVLKARRVKAGFESFETAELATGKTLRVRFLKTFENSLANNPARYDDLVKEVKEAYTTLVAQHPFVFAKPKNQEMALKLLQGGLNKDEVLKVLKNPARLADDDPAVIKAVNGWLGPEHGITNPRLAKQVMIAKASPEAFEEAAKSMEEAMKLKKLAAEFILTTGKNERPYLVALARDGNMVTYQFRATIGSIDNVGPRLAERYQAVMDSFPELLNDKVSIKNVLKLVQREEFTAGEIGELLAKGGKANSNLRKKFIDVYLKKAYGITEDADAVRVLNSGIDPASARMVKAYELKKQGLAELFKKRRVLQKRLGEGISGGADVEKELKELVAEIAGIKNLITPGEKIYDKGGRLVAVLGRETGSVSLVPEHFPSFFNQLVVLKARAADTAYAALRPLAEGAGTAVSAAHTFAVDYAVPFAKVVKNKALEPQFRAMLAMYLPPAAVASFDTSKAYIQSAEDFMASEEIKVAVPVVAVNDDGSEELAFVMFQNGYDHDLGNPVLDPEQFSVPDGKVALCSYYDVLVEATIDDHVSRGCTAVFPVASIEKFALGSLNALNIEGFSTERQEWLGSVVAPMASNIEVSGALSEQDEDDIFNAKADEFLENAGLAYDTARSFRENGLTDLEVQKLLWDAKDISSFNGLRKMELGNVKKLAAAS
ncbi:hypothetical protein HYU17_00600 [Candidatus Woesearchaeota archaeon]|nr:hypothetical protein [Candidatus Woesearchaeota archaeon]